MFPLNKRKCKPCYLLLAAMWITSYAGAQSRLVTLKEAVNTAQKNYPAIRAKSFYAQAAEEKVSQTRREYIPALKLHEQVTYGSGNSLAGTFFPLGVVVPTSGGIFDKNYWDAAYGSISMAYMEWPVFAFGQQSAKVNISRSEQAVANADLQNEIFQHSAKTIEAYLDLLALQKYRMSEEKNLQRAQTIRKLVVSIAKNGLRPGVDSSFANAEVSKARLALMNARKNENTQKTYLAQLMGITDTSFVPDTSLLARIPADSLVSNNLAANPLIGLYNSQVALSQSKEYYIKKSYLPKITMVGVLNGRGSGMSPEDPTLSDKTFLGGTRLTRFNYAVGLAATFNIADYPRMHSEAEAEKLRTSALQEEEKGQELNIQDELTSAEENLKLAIAQAQEAPVELSAASQAYQQSLKMYHTGLVTLSDLAQAYYNLDKAEADVAVTNNAAWKALLLKAVTAGNMNVILNQL